MSRLIHALEPLWWGLFVTGTFLSALLLPGVLLVLCLGAPLGFVSAEAVSYERMHGLVASLPGRLVALALVVTCLWNGAHHLRHFNIDLGGLSRDIPVATVLYGIAGVGSLLALATVIGL
ncbi:MAG: fumarate reductase subunit FrdD [Myxococcota bacterium]